MGRSKTMSANRAQVCAGGSGIGTWKSSFCMGAPPCPLYPGQPWRCEVGWASVAPQERLPGGLGSVVFRFDAAFSEDDMRLAGIGPVEARPDSSVFGVEVVRLGPGHRCGCG